jgi:transcriptional regulator with XRE-family HTH domain
MLRTNLPKAIRHLRRHRGWRQSDLAARSGVSRQAISRIERGLLGGVPLRTLGRITDAFGATADVYVRWEGEQLDRLIDSVHAAAQEKAAATLRAAGWMVRPEVSFNHYGERGRVDLLAFHPRASCVIVVEVKSDIGDTQETLGKLDVKTRLGHQLAAGTGWPAPTAVIPALVLVESGSSRRVVDRHPELFAGFSRRGRAALAWIHDPLRESPVGILWFVKLPSAHGVSVSRRSRVRCRLGAS